MTNLTERRAQAEETAQLLKNNVGEDNLGYQLAHAIAATRGYCAYCCVDLLQKDSPLYAVDHVLPKKKYSDYEDDNRNWTLSCAACNDFKGKFDPICNGESAEDMLTHCHAELVERSRVHICLERAKSERKWRATTRRFVRG